MRPPLAGQARSVAAASDARGRVDGVHYDFEPVQDGDRGCSPSSTAPRWTVTGSAGAVLSVAAEPIEPLPRLARVAGTVRPQWWSVAYVREVASQVDQVALMTYDTCYPVRRAAADSTSPSCSRRWRTSSTVPGGCRHELAICCTAP